jgi:hypothetical protein
MIRYDILVTTVPGEIISILTILSSVIIDAYSKYSNIGINLKF